MITRAVFLLILALGLVGCDTGFRQMGPTEYGLKFRKIPLVLGGGVADKVIAPREMVMVMPWETIYRIDTAVKDLSWGKETSREADDYVYTRALDGNEVALGVTIRYQVKPDPEKLKKLVRSVATTNEEVSELVKAVARADIRTFLNELKTSEFLDKSARYSAIDKVAKNMNDRLNEPYGIEVTQVNLDEYKFERLLEDGTIDASYQDKLREIQRLREDTEREKSRIATVEAKKKQELNEAQGEVNRALAEAQGVKQQAMSRADAYFQAKENEAKGILSKGKAEVQGLIEQVNALSGPGGQNLLKLDLARALLKNDPSFVVMNDSGQSTGIDVKKVDTNQLLSQIGVFEGLKEEKKKSD